MKRADTQADRHMENDSLAQMAYSQEQPHWSIKFTLKTTLQNLQHYVTTEARKEEKQILRQRIYTS